MSVHAMGELVWESLFGEDTNEHGLPPGFRFHPTDEELVTFYLASKVFNGGFDGVSIVEVDLNRCEPWELPDIAKMGESEWYFYSLRDRKYPTGLRTNRATGAGYWKATGKDREVYSNASGGALIGMKKTLVFYKGRAPRGEKTKWVLHEYRLEGDLSCRHACKEEWVICRIFHKAGGEKKNPFFHAHGYPFEPPTASAALLPSILEMQTLDSVETAKAAKPIHTLLNNDPYNHVSAPGDIPSLLRPPYSHNCDAREANPVTKQCVHRGPPPELQEEAVFGCTSDWVHQMQQHTNPPLNPFVLDVGLFDNPSSALISGPVHDVMTFLIPPPPPPLLGESGPLVM